jgi:hypothetical protein
VAFFPAEQSWRQQAALCVVLGADPVGPSPEPVAAAVKGPLTLIQQLVARLSGRAVVDFDPEEAAAYKEAAREAFRTTGVVLRRPEPSRPEPSRPASPGDRRRPDGTPEGQIDTVIDAPSYNRKRTVTRSIASGPLPEIEIVDPGATLGEDVIADASEPGQGRNQAKASAPGHLLREPANVTRVADDFFDGVVRRVEGDR